MLGAALLFGAAGCGNEQGKADQAHASTVQAADTHSQDIAAKTADQAVVSRSLAFGKVNPAPYGIFTAKEQIDVFTKAIQSAEQIQGVLDVVQPDYDAVI